MAFIVVSAFLVVAAVAIVAVLCFWSWPGKPKPFLDDGGRPLPHSVSEKVRLDINGVEQGMFIKGERQRRDPVLLFLHGGMPEYFLAQRYPTGLEDRLRRLLVGTARRGAVVPARTCPRESVTVEQLVADTLAVTNYLRRRFGRTEDLPDGPFRRELPRDARRGPGA